MASHLPQCYLHLTSWTIIRFNILAIFACFPFILYDPCSVSELLKYHILDRSICSSAVLGPITLTTLEGQKLNLSCDIHDRLTVNDIPVTSSDNVAYNGVIHHINKLLVPDSGKMCVCVCVCVIFISES